jgi:hypothetical protein
MFINKTTKNHRFGSKYPAILQLAAYLDCTGGRGAGPSPAASPPDFWKAINLKGAAMLAFFTPGPDRSSMLCRLEAIRIFICKFLQVSEN